MIDDVSSFARLRLSKVRASDEGEYKCEITFLDITKDCPVVQIVKLTTLGQCRYNKAEFLSVSCASNAIQSL